MRRLVNESLTDVRGTAVHIVRSCGRERRCQLVLLRGWLERTWRFIPDPVNVELVHRPQRLLAEWGTHGYITGDCDDAAVLGAALGKAIGFPARFVVLAFFGPRAPFAHVYTELSGPDGWVELDVTKTPWRLPPTRRLTVEV